MPSHTGCAILLPVTDGQWVTTAEAARQIGVGKSTLQRWAKQGLVTPAWRTPAGMARWDIEDLRRQLKMPGAPLGSPAEGEHGERS
jgi:excisionase family DNA binding protein